MDYFKHEKAGLPNIAAVKQQIRTSFQIDNIDGLELITSLYHIAQLSKVLESHLAEELGLSGARWRLLLRLFIDEEMGNSDGLTPSHLSQAQRVRKNTISSLLRGLEDQGLIRRDIDPEDLRIFRIYITPEGRQLVRSTAPDLVSRLNKSVSVLDPEEIKQLKRLLEKLQQGFIEQYSNLNPQHDPLQDK